MKRNKTECKFFLVWLGLRCRLVCCEIRCVVLLGNKGCNIQLWRVAPCNDDLELSTEHLLFCAPHGKFEARTVITTELVSRGAVKEGSFRRWLLNIDQVAPVIP